MFIACTRDLEATYMLIVRDFIICMVVLGLCGSFYLFKRVFWSKLAGVSEW